MDLLIFKKKWKDKYNKYVDVKRLNCIVFILYSNILNGC